MALVALAAQAEALPVAASWVVASIQAHLPPLEAEGLEEELWALDLLREQSELQVGLWR